MTTMTRTSIDGWTALLLAIVLAIAVALIGLSGTDLPAFGGTPAITGGHPEVITNQVPAYVEEAIVYGDRAPGDVTPGARILPAYLVESSYYGG